MKKLLTRILGMVVAFVSVCYNFCYADLIVPGSRRTTSNIIHMVLIGVVITVLVVISLIILVKSKKNKNEKNNNEK